MKVRSTAEICRRRHIHHLNMRAAQLSDSLVCGVNIEGIGKRLWNSNMVENFRFKTSTKGRLWHSNRMMVDKRGVPFDNFVRCCGLASDQPISDVGLSHSSDVQDHIASDNGSFVSKKIMYDLALS